MKLLLLTISFCVMCGLVSAELPEHYDNDRLADAIKLAENSTKYPYGIKSINTGCDEVYARKICLNTIRNNKVRFYKQDKYKDYIEFLGSRYCPVNDHALNRHWVGNVKALYNKGV